MTVEIDTVVAENKRLKNELEHMTRKKQKFKQKYLQMKESVSSMKLGGQPNVVQSIIEPKIEKYLEKVREFMAS